MLNRTPAAVREALPPAPGAARFGARAAAGALLGIVLSGPLAVALVGATHPQPPWQDAALFARSYHPVQLLPYLGGIVLVASLVALIASLHALARVEHKALTGTALGLCAAFAALIFFNYVVQTTFLPELARHGQATDAGIIAAFSMANPRSLAWGVEMWGWGLLGAATWLVAPVFGESRLERSTALAFVCNGPVSILGAVWTVLRPGWVMSPAGLAAFAAWNVLLTAMAALAYLSLRRGLNAQPAVLPAPATSPRPTSHAEQQHAQPR